MNMKFDTFNDLRYIIRNFDALWYVQFSYFKYVVLLYNNRLLDFRKELTKVVATV